MIKILVVDDMPSMRKMICGMLSEHGFELVTEADSGDAAWSLIKEQMFDVVIADWSMPGGISGIDLLRAIRSFKPTRYLPFLMVTAKGEERHVSEAADAGATEYVIKPFCGATLATKIMAVTSAKIAKPKIYKQ